MKTIVVGLGNPILGDDGVGWRVADEVKKQLDAVTHIDVDCVSLGGISLMECLIGYDRAVLIDAFAVDESVGSISVMDLDQLPDYSAFHITSAHDTSLQNAIELGRSLGAQLPNEVTVIGIATRHIHDFGEELSPGCTGGVAHCENCALPVERGSNSVIKTKVIRIGDFLHLGCNA